MSEYVLCRKNVADIGEPVRYCAKPIEKPNPSDLCAPHASRMPIWPVNDDGSPCTPELQGVA